MENGCVLYSHGQFWVGTMNLNQPERSLGNPVVGDLFLAMKNTPFSHLIILVG